MATHRPNPPPPPAIEVACAGCGETLEVEPGVTEFICPDCNTPQSLPPELLPRKRKAIPLTKTHLPCGSCSALLNVPHGLTRFKCPRCEVELAVDQERLRGYMEERDVGEAGRRPTGLRLNLAVDVVEVPNQNNVANQPVRAPLHSQAAYIEQNSVTTPRAPHTSNIDSEIQNLTPVSSRGLISTSINNIRTSIPASMTHVPSRLNTQQAIVEEAASEEDEEIVPTPPPTKRPVSKQNKKTKKQSTKELELSLRRSKRIADSSPPTKKPKSQATQSQPSQSQLSQSQRSEDNNETPLDIARHYSDLFPLNNDRLWNPTSPIPNPESEMPVSQIPDMSSPLSNTRSEIPDLNPHGREVNSDNDEGDEAYVAESDSSQSEAEPDSNHEPEPESVLQEALIDAQKRRGLIPGNNRKSLKSNSGKRGPSKCLEIWDRPDDDPIGIEFNNVGQPIGETAFLLSNFLGSISRDGKLVPLNYMDWRSVPAKFKDAVWYIVKSKFRMQEDNRRYVLKAVGRNWSGWKSRLKKSHYDIHDDDEARLADLDESIEPDQWPFLVNFWGSDKGKKRSATNKASAVKQKNYHAMGRKSFARIREEERLKRANKEEPSRAEMFILTHTRKDGTPIDEESAQIIARLREELAKADASPSSSKSLKTDILSKVLGKEHRHIRTYGLLPTGPTNLRETTEPPVKEQMEAMERRHREMEEEMRVMRETIMGLTGSVPPGFASSSKGGDS